jgi:hypothetical protein
VGTGRGQEAVPMKKFSPPQMKEVSFPTPYTLYPLSSQEAGVSGFVALLFCTIFVLQKKDNARFLKVLILFSCTNIGF